MIYYNDIYDYILLFLVQKILLILIIKYNNHIIKLSLITFDKQFYTFNILLNLK